MNCHGYFHVVMLYLQRDKSVCGCFLCRESATLKAFLHSKGKWAGDSMAKAVCEKANILLTLEHLFFLLWNVTVSD